MKEYRIVRKNQKATIRRKQKRAKVITFSECELIRCKDVTEELTDADRKWIVEKRNENILNQSYLVTMFLEKISPLHLELEREVFFHISMNNYFLDFFDQKNCIAIEIDGSQHFNKISAEYDRRRDAYFKFIGVQTIRFAKHELENKNFIKNYFLPKYEKAFRKQCEERKAYAEKSKIVNKEYGRKRM